VTTAAARRAAVEQARSHHAGLSERRACRFVGCALSSQRYRSLRPPQEALRQRLRELALERVRWGYRRLHVLLKREGMRVNHKRVYRLYREEGLAVRRRKRKRVAVARQPFVVPTKLNECWCLDYMSDALASGRQYRILNVLDLLSREDLASEVDLSLPAARLVRVLEEIALVRGYPARLLLDNGPEGRGRAVDAWAYEHGVVLDFIQPGKPIQNAVIESFNGRMRDELLNSHWWRTIAEAQEAIARYREDYNEVRPHGALDDRAPAEFARAYAANINPQRLAS
jgi:putative transposase